MNFNIQFMIFIVLWLLLGAPSCWSARLLEMDLPDREAIGDWWAMEWSLSIAHSTHSPRRRQRSRRNGSSHNGARLRYYLLCQSRAVKFSMQSRKFWQCFQFWSNLYVSECTSSSLFDTCNDHTSVSGDPEHDARSRKNASFIIHLSCAATLADFGHGRQGVNLKLRF